MNLSMVTEEKGKGWGIPCEGWAGRVPL